MNTIYDSNSFVKFEPYGFWVMTNGNIYGYFYDHFKDIHFLQADLQVILISRDDKMLIFRVRDYNGGKNFVECFLTRTHKHNPR